MSYGIATVAVDGSNQTALVRDNQFVLLSHWNERRSLFELLQDWDNVIPLLEKWAVDEGAFNSAASLDSVRICLPYRPRQVFCTGANYKKHVVGLIMGDPSMRVSEHDDLPPEELQRKVEERMEQRINALPFCFIKLPSCAIGPQDDVILPANVEKPDWELELGVVIGKRAHRVSVEEALNHVAGYVIVNDLTAREHIFRRDGSAMGGDWLSGKCFPTFLPFGPMVVPRSLVPDPYDLTITLAVNGKVYQDEGTSDMLASIERQIAYLSDRVILEPGDVICTGSPYGNGSAFGVFLKPGDEITGTITGLGTQRNRCVAEQAR